MTRRYARATDDLFSQLERVLPDERGADGTPSVHDFARTDLLRAQSHFEEYWDELAQPVPGRPDYRTHIFKGTFVASFVVTGQMSPQHVIELTDIDIDLHGLAGVQPDDE